MIVCKTNPGFFGLSSFVEISILGLYFCVFLIYFLKCISAAYVEISFTYVKYYNLLHEQIKLLLSNIYYLTQKVWTCKLCIDCKNTNNVIGDPTTWHFKYDVQ